MESSCSSLGKARLRTPSEVCGVVSFLLSFIRVPNNSKMHEVTDSRVRLD
jgi:hypothetical protein